MGADWLKALRIVAKDLRVDEAPPPVDDEELKQQTAERLLDAARRLLKVEAEVNVMLRRSP